MPSVVSQLTKILSDQAYVSGGATDGLRAYETARKVRNAAQCHNALKALTLTREALKQYRVTAWLWGTYIELGIEARPVFTLRLSRVDHPQWVRED